MKNSKKLLACTLGLMLGVGFLVGCGGNGDTPTTEPAETTTYTVTFKDGNEEVKVETVVAGEKCPEYIPADKEGYDFMGWYVSRSVRDETTKFDFNTPINSNTTLYAWYKAEFKASTDTYYVVGSFTGVDYGTGDGFGPGSYWDGGPGSAVQENRKLVLNQDKLAEEKNVFEFTVDLINFGEKFRLIKSTDGLVSDGWVDTFGYDLVSKVLDKDGNELTKEEMLTEQDSKNIGVNFSGKLHISLALESDFSPNGEIVLTILEEAAIATPDYVSFIGSFPASNWSTDIDLTTADEGFTWTGSHDFAVGDLWKLRMNHDWASSWGFDNLRTYPAEALENEPNADGNGFSGNIRVLIAGTYTVTFDYLAMKIDVTYVPGEVEEPEPELPTVISTCAGALAAELDADVEITGVVASIDSTWDDYWGNMSVVLQDDTGSILVYRLATKVGKGDTIKVTGKIGTYNDVNQIVNATAEIIEKAPEQQGVIAIEFSDKANRTEYSTSKQVWEQNGIKVTNEKGSSTSNVGDYYNPARFYKGSSLLIEYTEAFSKVVINMSGDKYLTTETVTGATLTVSGAVATIVLDAPATSISIAQLLNQVRASSIEIYL